MRQPRHKITSRPVTFLVALLITNTSFAEVRTWDGAHSIEQIEVTMVYFVPSDRRPLSDWRERIDYYARRIEKFHTREYQGQSKLKVSVHSKPFISKNTTDTLRQGDADAIYFKTLGEVDASLNFGRWESKEFPILLVLSEINWRPLDDFYRMSVNESGEYRFEGTYENGRHFPGAVSGGARATYLSRQRKGWGLVSGDGWRVPYCGTDCVVYHEGVGHTIGLPHPDSVNGSVMSVGQYRGWISESWLDDNQQSKLGWQRPVKPKERTDDLFSTFKAVPRPTVPEPGQEVHLKFDRPLEEFLDLRIQIQTDIRGPWIEVSRLKSAKAGENHSTLGIFDRPTPVSYRIDATAKNGDTEELWGYFQVRKNKQVAPRPPLESVTQEFQSISQLTPDGMGKTVDLIAGVDLSRDAVAGTWNLNNGILETPKRFGARLQLTDEVPTEYRLIAIVEPLDEPNGLILGHQLDGNRFLTLFNYRMDEHEPVSAIENIDGENVGTNASTVRRKLFKTGQLSEIICTVRKKSVVATCDGQVVFNWRGDPDRLTLGEYWATPNPKALFVGAYDCRYRFHRITITTLSD